MAEEEISMKDERRETLLYICRRRRDDKEKGKSLPSREKKKFFLFRFSLCIIKHTRDVFIKIEQKEFFCAVSKSEGIVSRRMDGGRQGKENKKVF